MTDAALSAAEAERYIEALAEFPMKEVGSSR
jgi:hypothetical protein